MHFSKAVSYTHLDVYKRQPQIAIFFHRRTTGGNDQRFLSGQFLLVKFGPVSYTHLVEIVFKAAGAGWFGWLGSSAFPAFLC